MELESLAIHGGQQREESAGATAMPIYQTASYAFATAENLAAVFAGTRPGYVYTRMANPTTVALEQRITALEKGVGSVACASGMAAITSVAVALTRAGDHVVAAAEIFGGTASLFRHTLARFNVETTFIPVTDMEAVRRSMRENTRFIFVETVGNPSLKVANIPALAEAAHARDIPLVVDSTVTTPILIRPGEHGADIVIHSLSKFINGHGNSIGGIVVDTGNYSWRNGRFSGIAALGRKAGNLAFLAYLRSPICRDLGACPSPFNSFLHLQGVATLGARMERHCANAMALARYLAAHPKVREVRYPGLPDHPQHEIASRLFGERFGALITVRLSSAAAAFRFVNATHMAQTVTNLGDLRTIVIHPASTIFADCDAESQEAAGVTTDMVRLSVGIEAFEDIRADVDHALGEIKEGD